MKEVFDVSDQVFSAMVAVDILIGNLWMAVLLYLASVAPRLDARLRADTTAIDELRHRVEAYQAKHARIPSLPDLMLIAGIGFGSMGLGHLLANPLAEGLARIAPGLERKRPDLVFEGVLGDEAPAPWRGQVDQVFFRGRPYENEVVFHHRASRTLILCDLAFHFRAGTHPVTRLLMQLIRSYDRFGPSRLDPLLIRDRKQARQSLERILAWDFDRIVVAHGDVLEHGGRQALREGYAWLLAT